MSSPGLVCLETFENNMTTCFHPQISKDQITPTKRRACCLWFQILYGQRDQSLWIVLWSRSHKLNCQINSQFFVAHNSYYDIILTWLNIIHPITSSSYPWGKRLTVHFIFIHATGANPTAMISINLTRLLSYSSLPAYTTLSYRLYNHENFFATDLLCWVCSI